MAELQPPGSFDETVHASRVDPTLKEFKKAIEAFLKSVAPGDKK